MPNRRSWTDQQLRNAVSQSFSLRSTIKSLGLIPAGGNYSQIKAQIKELNLDTSHFTGKLWNKGKRTGPIKTRTDVAALLTQGSAVQSYKLKKRLFEFGIKHPKCEICEWEKQAEDGRIPVELDHINGDHSDNRLCNLRILCPNCHSLQSTHRGKNKKK